MTGGDWSIASFAFGWPSVLLEDASGCLVTEGFAHAEVGWWVLRGRGMVKIKTLLS